MIYLFCGEDYYESFNRCTTTAQNLAAKTSSNINIVNADELTDINYILQLLDGVDMFSSTGILVLKRLINNKKFIEYFADNFDRLSHFDIIIWQDNKVDSKLKLVKKIAEKKLLFNSELPKEGEMKNWIMTKAKEKGLLLNINQANFLFERYQFNKYSIISELEKLNIYLKVKNKKTLTEDVMEEVMGFNIKGDMWKFLDYFSNKNKLKALVEFEKITKYEDNSQLLISMLNRELKLMSQYKYVKESGRDLSELKLPPFIIKKTADKSKNFTAQEVKMLIKRLFDLDFAIKTGSVEEKSALVLFLATI